MFRIVILLFSLLTIYHTDRGQAEELLNRGWEYSWDSKNGPWQPYPDATISIKNNNKYLWLRKKLEFHKKISSPGIDMRVKTFFEAFIDDEKVYDYSNGWHIENLRGGVRHLFPIKGSGGSSFLYLKVASAGEKIGLEGIIKIGEYPQLIKNSISQDATRLALGLLFCVFSLLLLVAFAMTKEVMLLHISGFGLNMGIWTLSFCHRITQETIFGGTRFFDSAIYWSSYLAPIFILWFISKLKFIRFRSLLIWARNIFIVFAAVVIAGSLLSMFTLRSANYIFNLLLIPTGILILSATIISALKGDKESRIILAGILFVGVYTLIDSLSYTGLIQDQLKSEVPQGHWGMFAIYFSLIIIWMRSYQHSQRELEESKKYRAISALSCLLAHDIRRPFSKIKSFLELIKPTIKDGRVYEMYSALESEIAKDTSSVESMLEDIMQFGAVSTHERSSTSLASIIQESLIESVNYVPKSGISIEVDISEGALVNVFAPEIKRVFSNIFTNALEVMGSGNLLKISVAHRSSRVIITISNTGSRIAPEDIEKVFEPNFSKRHGGHGIGLSIAQKYVLEHGGTIKCKSDDDMVSFIFDLPKGTGEKSPLSEPTWPKNTDEIIEKSPEKTITVAKSEEKVVQEALRELERRENFKIVVLEDEKFYQDYIFSLLKDALDRGVSVIFCQNDRDFENSAKEADLVICDIDLGLSKDGIEILKDTSFSKKPYVCIHSQRWEKEYLKRALDAGADDILAKPMTKTHLYGMIAKSLKN